VQHFSNPRGFVEGSECDPRWEAHLLQAIATVFAPELKCCQIDQNWDLVRRLGFQSDDLTFLSEFQRLSGFSIHFDASETPRTLEEMRRFLKLAAPDIYPTEPILPAFVVAGSSLLAKRPGWMHFFGHQFGGYLTEQNFFCGAILPLRLNRSLAKGQVDELFDAFTALSETSSPKKLSESFPLLKDLAFTQGQSYSPEQLRTLFDFVSNYFDIPNISSGREAVVELGDCPPIRYFKGWQVARVCGDAQSGTEFTPEIYQELRLLLDSEPKCYLMWANSD
jgi:hypothetical protein